MSRALLVVDLQNDFLPGGALGVPRGDEVVAVANHEMLTGGYALIVGTQDWHPPHHLSFASQHPSRHVGEVIELDGSPQILWPDHCVQNSAGAEFAPALRADLFDAVVHKGTDPAIDSYSAFWDNQHRRATGLAEILRAHKITDLAILGLATDYCVKFTTLDARAAGFSAAVLVAGCRGIELQPGDCKKALDELKRAGVRLI